MLFKKMKDITTYMILLFCSENAIAQIDVAFRNIEQATSLDDIWNFNATVSQNSVVYFQVTVISDKEG